jgi:hypothetical protein
MLLHRQLQSVLLPMHSVLMLSTKLWLATDRDVDLVHKLRHEGPCPEIEMLESPGRSS